jgi:NTE family protein
MCRQTTGGRSFADLAIPFTAAAVDLNRQQPVALREGPLWEALVASTALPGLFPPELRGAQRLVDGLALVPVPTDALTEAGADVTVSVNLMAARRLPPGPGWRGRRPRTAADDGHVGPPDRVMDLAHLDQSVRWRRRRT